MPTRILELAEIVKAQTAVVDSYLRENNLPSPSFDEDGPVNFNIKSHEVERARLAALSAALELSDLLVGPALITRPVVSIIEKTVPSPWCKLTYALSSMAQRFKLYTSGIYLPRCLSEARSHSRTLLSNAISK